MCKGSQILGCEIRQKTAKSLSFLFPGLDKIKVFFSSAVVKHKCNNVIESSFSFC